MTNIDLSSEPTTNHIQDSQEEKETQNDFSPELEDAELIENEEVSEEEEYSKNSKSYEIPRPALTIDEASSILGKSIRALERSIAGKWGNKLPEGWHARKMKIDGESEWRIIPPPGFRIKHSSNSQVSSTTDNTDSIDSVEEAQTFEEHDEYSNDDSISAQTSNSSEVKNHLKLPGFGFSFENFINTASQKAKTEIARVAVGTNEQFDEHPTIVIDRSDDVERLLRELADTQKELAEERKQHMEDMKLAL